MTSAPVSLTTSDPSYPGSMSNMLGDPITKQALALGLTAIGQDVITGKSVSFKKAAMLSVADYASLRYLAGYFAPMISSATGESVISSKLAEALALTGTLMVSNYTGLFPRAEAEGVISAPNLGSGMFANAIESVVDASVLLVEREIATMALSKAGVL